MSALRRENIAGWLIAALWFVAPLYPSFVAMMPVAPPGLALLPPVASLGLLLGVLLSIIALAVLLVADGARSAFGQPLQRSMWLYAGLTVLIALCGLAPGFGLLYATFVVCTAVGTIAILHWGSVPRFAARMRWSMLLSCGVAAALALILWRLRMPAQLYAVGNGRAIGCFVVPGELAGYMGMFLPYALGVALTTNHQRERLCAWLVTALAGCAMVASISRAGLVGMAIGLALVAARFGRRWLLAYGALLCVLALVASRHLLDVHHNPAEDTNRLAIWIAALHASTLFPLFGVGPGGFARVYSLVRLPDGEAIAFHAHSLLLSTLAETGVVGLWALLQMWARFALEFRSAYRNADETSKTLGLSIAAGFVGTWLQSSIDVVQILVLGLWIPFMGVALLALRSGPRAATRTSKGGIASVVAIMALSACSGQQQSADTTATPEPVVSAHVATHHATPVVKPTATEFPVIILHAHRSGAAPVSIVVMQAERKLYKIDADANDSERTLAGTYKSRFTKPIVTFYNRDGTQMQATAAEADVDGATKVVTMLQNVELHTQDDTTLQCQRLRYDNRTDQAEGWDDVVIRTRQGDTLRGEHFTGDLHLQHVRIDGAQ